ncbi:hypothetical protein B0I32_110360 [Nonomuraea fuscirosea]|uniref:Uncharacterized protein n=1 Tax=Nonomuraea fuscirosea TaxID=1291556 RepID=A0A2T0MXV0_9ACTN|nr:hypothetical protein B0I32_110360 [Nonomuraea fuscirosea]
MPGGADRTHRNRISVIRSAGLPERIPHLETAPPAPSAFAVTRRTPRRYGKRHLAHSQSDEFVSACPGKQHSVRHAHACGLCSLRHIPRDRVLRAPPIHGGPVFRIAPVLGGTRFRPAYPSVLRGCPVRSGPGFASPAGPLRRRVFHRSRASRASQGFAPACASRAGRVFTPASTSRAEKISGSPHIAAGRVLRSPHIRTRRVIRGRAHPLERGNPYRIRSRHGRFPPYGGGRDHAFVLQRVKIGALNRRHVFPMARSIGALA